MTIADACRALGVGEGAGQDEIRSAYRRRARETHPDRGGAAEEFIKVQAAYEMLCALGGVQPSASEIPIPDDLRRLIDEIVVAFRRELDARREVVRGTLRALHGALAGYIAAASRNELGQFNDVFRKAWNDTLRRLLKEANEAIAAIVERYEGWFEDSTKKTFAEIQQERFRAFVRSKRFFALCVAPAAVTAVCLPALTFVESIGIGVAAALVSVVPTLLVKWIDCRRGPRQVKTFEVALFDVARADVVSQNSATLRRAQNGAVFAGVAGAVVARGMGRAGGPAALIGLAVYGVAEIASRIKNPTEKVRAALAHDLDAFLASAAPEVERIVLEGEMRAFDGLAARVQANYQERVQTMGRMLAAAAKN